MATPCCTIAPLWAKFLLKAHLLLEYTRASALERLCIAHTVNVRVTFGPKNKHRLTAQIAVTGFLLVMEMQCVL